MWCMDYISIKLFFMTDCMLILPYLTLHTLSQETAFNKLSLFFWLFASMFLSSMFILLFLNWPIFHFTCWPSLYGTLLKPLLFTPFSFLIIVTSYIWYCFIVWCWAMCYCFTFLFLYFSGINDCLASWLAFYRPNADFFVYFNQYVSSLCISYLKT